MKTLLTTLVITSFAMSSTNLAASPAKSHVKFKTEATYGKNGNKKTVMTYHSDSDTKKIEITHWKNGNLHETTTFHPNGVKKMYTTNWPNGNLKTHKEYRTDGFIIYSRSCKNNGSKKDCTCKRTRDYIAKAPGEYDTCTLVADGKLGKSKKEEGKVTNLWTLIKDLLLTE